MKNKRNKQKKGVIYMLLIQSFLICRKNTKKRLHELVQADKTDTPEFVRTNLQLIQLNRMLRYIVSGNWGGVKTREVFAFWVRVNYNIEQTAQHYRIPTQNVEKLVKQADRLISSRIERPLKLICSGNLFESEIEFNKSINKPIKSSRKHIKKEG